MNNILLIMLLCVFCGCNGQTSSSEPQAPAIQEQDVSINDWQKDKNGCLKIRTKELAETLIEKYNLKNKTQSEFLNVFGIPNKKEERNNQQVLIYYFDCVCDNGELVEGGDKCYAEFYFENDSLKNEIFLCE